MSFKCVRRKEGSAYTIHHKHQLIAYAHGLLPRSKEKKWKQYSACWKCQHENNVKEAKSNGVAFEVEDRVYNIQRIEEFEYLGET